MANKFYSVTKEIGGKTYIAQFNGLSAALKAIDESYLDNSSNIGVSKLTEYIFENVIVEPKNLTPDDFDTMEELNKVVAFGRDVMQGNFRDKKDQGATDATSKK